MKTFLVALLVGLATRAFISPLLLVLFFSPKSYLLLLVVVGLPPAVVTTLLLMRIHRRGKKALLHNASYLGALLLGSWATLLIWLDDGGANLDVQIRVIAFVIFAACGVIPGRAVASYLNAQLERPTEGTP